MCVYDPRRSGPDPLWRDERSSETMPHMRNDDDGLIESLERVLGYQLPHDYLRFLRERGSFEGPIAQEYLSLWPLAELPSINDSYGGAAQLPGLVLIGSNGAGEGVGFDFRRKPAAVVLLPFISTGWQDAVPQAASFTNFLENLKQGSPFRFSQEEA
jgi:hypothetical protein